MGVLRALRFPPTRRPSEDNHRCQRVVWLVSELSM